MCLDSTNAGNKRIKRSSTGFMIFARMPLINEYSNRLSTIELAVPCKEFVTMKVGVDTACHLLSVEESFSVKDSQHLLKIKANHPPFINPLCPCSLCHVLSYFKKYFFVLPEPLWCLFYSFLILFHVNSINCFSQFNHCHHGSTYFFGIFKNYLH